MDPKKLLIIGHGRHGKDTVAEILRDTHGYKFISSSEFVGREILWKNWGCERYENFEAMFADRANHRTKWFDMIAAYNTPDKTKTATTMLERGYDMYVGMRCKAEYEACVEAEVFDFIVWVDRSEHLPSEPKESMELRQEDADLVVNNNGDLEQLHTEVEKLIHTMGALDV